jgi:hypothetical protein
MALNIVVGAVIGACDAACDVHRRICERLGATK